LCKYQSKSKLPLINVYLTECRKLTREYLSNVCYTVAGPAFRQWVDLKINERNDKLKNDGDMIIEMDEEMYQSFQKSNAISSKYSYFECT
jgi:hypothetical protein